MSTIIVDKNQPGKVVVVMQTGPQGPAGSAVGAVGTGFLHYTSSNVDGAIPVNPTTAGHMTVGGANSILTSNGTVGVWLAAGSNGQFLSIVGGAPTWTSVPTATPGGSEGDFQINDGAGGFAARSPEGVYVDDFGAVGDGSTDDSQAFRDAIDAAMETGKRVVFVPYPEESYYFASKVTVADPVRIIGYRGPRKAKITTAPGIEAAFTCVNSTTASGETGGLGAEDAVIENLEIVCDPTATVVAYAPTTAYSIGQIIKSSAYNKHLYRVIRAGTTSSDTDAEAIGNDDAAHFPDRSIEWSAGATVRFGSCYRPTNPSQWDVLFIATSPAPGAGSATTGVSEPSWDYGIGNTTSDGGVTWTAVSFGYAQEMGTVVAVPITMSGIYSTAGCTIRNCIIRDAQCAGIYIIGNAAGLVVGDASNWRIDDTDIYLPGGQMGLGVYIRGGEIRFGIGRNIRVFGSHTTGQGGNALPVDGTQNEHGIYDQGFQGLNAWIGCHVEYCRGFDFWANGGASTTQFVGCTSKDGRVRLDAVSQWVGPIGSPLYFWSGSGQGYGSATTSMSSRGLHNAFESRANVNAWLNQLGIAHPWSDDTDQGLIGWRASFGRWYLSWANTVFSGMAISNRQIPVSTHIPAGEEAAAILFPKGFATGGAEDYHYEFANDSAFRSSLRGGWRRPGDIIKRADRAEEGDYFHDIIIEEGYTGPAWTAEAFVQAFTAAGSTSSIVASVVTPTDTSNTDAFQCTTGGQTGVSEPDWTTAPNLNDTISDGTAVWTNVGTQPVLSVTSYVGEIPTGGGQRRGIAVKNSHTFGQIDLTREECDEKILISITASGATTVTVPFPSSDADDAYEVRIENVCDGNLTIVGTDGESNFGVSQTLQCKEGDERTLEEWGEEASSEDPHIPYRKTFFVRVAGVFEHPGFSASV